MGRHSSNEIFISVVNKRGERLRVNWADQIFEEFSVGFHDLQGIFEENL